MVQKTLTLEHSEDEVVGGGVTGRTGEDINLEFRERRLISL